MSVLHMLATPLFGVAGLALVGAGLAAMLTSVAPDVRAALVVPLGAAVVACSSTLVLVGAPVRPVAVSLAAAGGVMLVVARRHIRVMARAALLPALVGLVALSLASIPAIASGSWDASSSGNGDLYYWVSESRALLDGPAPAPATQYPDRDAYELVMNQNFPAGIAFSLSSLSLASGRSPDSVYSTFAALIDVVLTLTVFVLARLALRWSPARSAIAAVLVGSNAFLLFATFFGWQAQLLLTSFSLLALAGMYSAFERGPLPSLVVVGGLGSAAALCTYGAAFAPFVALGAIVSVAFLALHRDRYAQRRVLKSIGAIALFTLFAAALPIVRGFLLTGTDVSGFGSSRIWDGSQVGLPSEPLGLVPRVAWSARIAGAWSVLSLAVAALLYMLGFLRARREPAGALLGWGSGAALAAIVLLAVFGPNPYLSLKWAGYATPLLMLTVVAALPIASANRTSRIVRVGWIPVAAVAATMFLLATLVVEVRASRLNLHSESMAGLARVSEQIPVRAAVGIDVKDAWHQSWAIYYLRDRRVVIPHPQYFLTPLVARAQETSRASTQYVLGHRASGPVIWRGSGLVLSVDHARQPS